MLKFRIYKACLAASSVITLAVAAGAGHKF
jgi:hypothetical protein